MRKIIFFAMLLSFLSGFAGNITVLSDNEIFHMVNKKSKKIYPYHILTPNTSIKVQVSQIDSLEILTRQIITSDLIEYQYSVQSKDSLRSIQKSARSSSVSSGVSGEKISTYNKFVMEIPASKEVITVKNVSKHSIIIKFNADKYTRKLEEVDFVAFTPEKYGKEVVLNTQDNNYTYFSPNDREIILTLDGPMQLKIISRLLFEDTITSHLTYRYEISTDDEFIVEHLETAVKSSKTNLINNNEIGVSTGNVQFVDVENGKHQIRVKAPDDNRNVIFRFFINKNRIGR
jgi:hypothetical protein